MNDIVNTATILSFALSVLIPFVSSLLAKAHWPGELVGALTLAIAAANGFLTEWAANVDSYDWKHGLLYAGVSFAIAVLSRFAILKDTKLDARLLETFSGPRPADEPADGDLTPAEIAAVEK